MEKLQAAIEKARAQREAARQDSSSAAPGKTVTDARPGAGIEVELSDGGSWSGLPELTLDAQRLRRKRVFPDLAQGEATYYDRLRTKVLQLCRDNGWKRVVITSPSQGCGKTTTCANLIASFARQSDRRILALDMDMRRPGLGPLLGMKDRSDLSAYFEDRAEFESVAMRIGSNVIVGANFNPHRNPAQVMLKDRTHQRIDELQNLYQPDLILYDTPPLLSVDDTAALLKHVDCAMIVAGAEMSTIEQIDLCEKEVAEQTNVLGVVLNRCNYLDDTEAYGYGY